MLFLFLKIVIFLASFPDQIKFMKCGHVQQISFNRIHENFAVQTFLYPCKRCFPIWKSLFFVASPPDEIHEIFAIQNILYPCKRCFLLWKLTFSVASPPYLSLKKSSKFNLKISQPWKIFGPLQTLFPPLKIDIFCCIVPPIFH